MCGCSITIYVVSEISHHRLLGHPVWLLQPRVLSAFKVATRYKPGYPVDPQGATGSVYPTQVHPPTCLHFLWVLLQCPTKDVPARQGGGRDFS